MSVNFIMAQIIGGVALIILMLSFQKNNKETLLRFQILSSMLYAIQYLFLNASTGCLMNFACMIRNVIFNKYKDRKVPTYWLGIVLALMILLSVISYNGVISLLPMIAVVLYSGIMEWKLKNSKNYRNNFMFIIYLLQYKSNSDYRINSYYFRIICSLN